MTGIVTGEFYVEAGCIASFVDFIGKHGQRPQGNAVAGFDNIQVVVADRIGKHGGHQGSGTGGGTHPQNVVVTPLDIHAVAVHQGVHTRS